MRLRAIIALLILPSMAGAVEVQFDFAFDADGPVYVAGTFNNWDSATSALERIDAAWHWMAVLDLPPGRYEYKFVVDDVWYRDPFSLELSPDGYGGYNSVIHVGEDGSRIAASDGWSPKNYKFRIQFEYEPLAQGSWDVFLAGSMNGWKGGDIRLIDPDGDGTYATMLQLGPGDYQYHYVVNGVAFSDPANPPPESESRVRGSGSPSVLTVHALHPDGLQMLLGDIPPSKDPHMAGKTTTKTKLIQLNRWLDRHIVGHQVRILAYISRVEVDPHPSRPDELYDVDLKLIPAGENGEPFITKSGVYGVSVGNDHTISKICSADEADGYERVHNNHGTIPCTGKLVSVKVANPGATPLLYFTLENLEVLSE